MGHESIWEELWDRLNPFYSILVSQLTAQNERLWSQISHQETYVFPFTGYLTLGKHGTPGEEDLVLEWSIRRDDDDLLAYADICRGDGTVLAALSASKLNDPIDPEQVFDMLERGIRFFRKNLFLIKHEVCY